ncbi:MAG TPA: hypothetical protein VFN09_00430 [Rhodanobacteraceae bacterium]|nr:hypothetical protein [Rhodanobacteraceae bacterium]
MNRILVAITLLVASTVALERFENDGIFADDFGWQDMAVLP